MDSFAFKISKISVKPVLHVSLLVLTIIIVPMAISSEAEGAYDTGLCGNISIQVGTQFSFR